MRIAQVNSYFYPFMIGGIEWYIYHISRELVKMGHEVDVLTSAETSNHLPSQDKLDGIRIIRIPLMVNLSYRLKIWNGLTHSLTKGNYDIIHTYDYAQFHTFSAIMARRLGGPPVALTVYDLHSQIPRSFLKSAGMRSFDLAMARRAMKSVDRILTRTPILAAMIENLGIPPNKVLVTPSGIPDEALFPVDGIPFRTEHSTLGPMILYVGRINPSKGLEFLIRAAPHVLKSFPDAKFVLIGPDQLGYRSKLRNLAVELKLQNAIMFLNPINDYSEKMRAFAACDVFVLPSGYEGFGQVLVEAMAQRKPVIGTNVGSIPWLIRKGQEGLIVKYGDTEQLGLAIISVLESKERSLEMGLQGWKRASEFGYHALARELVEIYASMIAR